MQNKDLLLSQSILSVSDTLCSAEFIRAHLTWHAVFLPDMCELQTDLKFEASLDSW